MPHEPPANIPPLAGPNTLWDIQGAGAGGGFELDIAWRDGKVTDYRPRSEKSREATVRMNGEAKTVKSERPVAQLTP